MQKKFLIIGPASSENTSDLVKEILLQGHIATVANISDFAFTVTAQGLRISLEETSLETFDILIFRAFNKNSALARIIARTAIQMKKTVLDQVIAERAIEGKLGQAEIFATKNIPHPKTFHTLHLPAFLHFLKEQSFPFIAKPIHGQKGQGIKLVQNQEEAEKIFTAEARETIFQEYLPIQYDIRVFIVGGQVLGGMKRYVLEGDYRSNASLGAKTENFAPSKEMITLALEATKAFGYEVAGVDIIEHNNQLFVLEVNDTPQWQGFKEATGINPAPFIIKYALEKTIAR